MQRPSVSALDKELCDVARRVSGPLASAGHQAWLVGGLVRDLVLGAPSKDVDLATDARPEVLERLFPGAMGVGRAFGTLVIPFPAHEVQVTTFRRDGDYLDGRRPLEVSYGTSLEEDAQRRDFTCNALYLDPETDRFEDPTGGLADLAARRLRAVGSPEERFAEDGLRLLRLARFAGRFGLEVESGTLEAARASLDRLDGVSPERVLQELASMATRPGTVRALELLEELGVLTRLRPTPSAGVEPALGDAPGLEALFAAWTLGLPRTAAETWLRERKTTRDLARRVLETLDAERELAALEARASRSRWIRLARRPAFPNLATVLRARGLGSGVGETLARLEALRAEGPSTLTPAPLLTSADLVAAGARPGPEFGALLQEAEGRQLDGLDSTRDEALAWLRARLARTS